MSALAQRRTAIAAAIMILFSVLQYVLITVNASPANAHHPEITASVVCVEKGTEVQFEATAWAYDGDQNRRHNNDVRVTVDGAEVGSGAFTAANGYSFSGSFDAEPYFGQTIEVVVTAVVKWGIDENLARAGDKRSTYVTVDEKCETKPEPVTVSVSGTCVTGDEGDANGFLSVTIDPASGAAVTVAGNEYTESISDIPVEAPGTYAWTAEAGDGYTLVGKASGEVEVEDCKRPEPEPVSVVVTGECIREGNFARIGIVMDPDGGATVALTAPDRSVREFSDDASVDGALGTWTYTSSAADGYVLTDGAEGTVEVRSCERTTSTTQPKEPKSALGDLVWFDENQNGRQDGGDLEFPIQAATVSLLTPDGTVLEEQVTGPDGLYLFDELDAGNYRVRVCLQGADYTSENALGVADDRDSDVFVVGDGCGMTGLINLPAGVTDLTWDAGVVVEVKGIQVEPTTTTAPPPIEPVTVETLPFTGVETEQTVLAALGALLAGAALLFFVSGRDEEAMPAADCGTSWSNRRH